MEEIAVCLVMVRSHENIYEKAKQCVRTLRSVDNLGTIRASRTWSASAICDHGSFVVNGKKVLREHDHQRILRIALHRLEIAGDFGTVSYRGDGG
jgi:hypothetical protein